MLWLDDMDGGTVDIDARLLCESQRYRTLICVTTDELTADELMELFIP